jgi:hypothetical protein
MINKIYPIHDLECPNCNESDLGFECIENISGDIYNGCVAECPECKAEISLSVMIDAQVISIPKSKKKRLTK